MPIQVVCDCGRTLLAKEADAGRQTKCPDCGRAFIILWQGERLDYVDVGPEKSLVEGSTSGKSIASFVLGILALVGCTFFTGIPAVILGILGLKEINRSGGRRTGQGFAIAGLVTGSLGIVVAPCLLVLLLPAVQKIREAARRADCVVHLKQIGLTLVNFESVNGSFPAPAIRDQNGRPLLSWRVAILPYIQNTNDTLFQEFHLDEPWDSPHNLTLLPRMPIIFACPSHRQTDPFTTTYRVVSGPGTMFELRPDMNRIGGQFPASGGMRVAEILDGLSNTIAVVESDQETPWTKPDELSLPPGGPMTAPPIAGLSSNHSGGFNVLFADGSVKFLRKTIDPALVRALITRNGGETLSPEN